MNAYELADEIDNFLKEEEQLPWGTKQVYLDMASTMIRQQAKRIEELEGRKGWFEINKDGYVQHKELSDEEIEAIYNKVYEEKHNNQVVALARAIIKASRGEA